MSTSAKTGISRHFSLQSSVMDTIADLLRSATAKLSESPTPELDAQMLLQHLLQVERTYLIAHDNRPVSPLEQTAYQALITRALSNEPLPYIIGHAPFYDSDFIVSPAVLIPRPETEELVEHALRWIRQRTDPVTVVDVGCGSGCIPITIARHSPTSTVYATDISSDAIDLAARNKETLQADVTFLQGDLLTPLQSEWATLPTPLLITANLPYITDSEWTQLPDGVKSYEPSLALRGGVDGLDLIRRLLKQLDDLLSHSHGPGDRAVFLEIGWQQGNAALHLAQHAFPTATVALLKDYAANDRFITIRLNATHDT